MRLACGDRAHLRAHESRDGRRHRNHAHAVAVPQQTGYVLSVRRVLGASGEEATLGVDEGGMRPACRDGCERRRSASLDPAEELYPRRLALGELRRQALGTVCGALPQALLHKRR